MLTTPSIHFAQLHFVVSNRRREFENDHPIQVIALNHQIFLEYESMLISLYEQCGMKCLILSFPATFLTLKKKSIFTSYAGVWCVFCFLASA